MTGMADTMGKHRNGGRMAAFALYVAGLVGSAIFAALIVLPVMLAAGVARLFKRGSAAGDAPRSPSGSPSSRRR